MSYAVEMTKLMADLRQLLDADLNLDVALGVREVQRANADGLAEGESAGIGEHHLPDNRLSDTADDHSCIRVAAKNDVPQILKMNEVRDFLDVSRKIYPEMNQVAALC